VKDNYKGANTVKKQLILVGTVILAAATSNAIAASGEELFKQHCTACHADGGNMVNPKKTLHKKDLEQSGVKNWQGIVKKMRTPGPGMTAFDKKTISDKDAKAIAEYILKTFK
jgi:cytochrome c6